MLIVEHFSDSSGKGNSVGNELKWQYVLISQINDGIDLSVLIDIPPCVYYMPRFCSIDFYKIRITEIALYLLNRDLNSLTKCELDHVSSRTYLIFLD